MPDLKSQHYLAHYGLTQEQYDLLWDLCGGRCPLCGNKFHIQKRPACIDHDHRTFKVRGLLCRQCNVLIGQLHENIGWMDAAVKYLRNPPALLRWGQWCPVIADAPPRFKPVIDLADCEGEGDECYTHGTACRSTWQAFIQGETADA